MKISTQLTLTGLFSAGIVAVISIVLLSTTLQIRQELAKNETAGEILNAATAVRYLALEYVLHHEERVQTQWQLKHASLSKLLTGTKEFNGTEEQAIIDGISDAQEDVNTLFSQLVTTHKDRETNKGKNEVLDELETRVTGQIANKAQMMISEALSLAERSRAGVLDAQQRASVAVLVFGGSVVFVVALMLFLTLRSVIRPLAKLREGTALVGAGNLDFRLGVTARNEFGDVAVAFDQMTDKLKGTTVSRNDLAKSNEVLAAEIVERNRVEERLQVLIQEMQETVNVLSSASSEILATTTQVASGAAETATAVSETTATVEEVKQTAQMASQKARYVSDSAQKVAQISQTGRQSVEGAIAGMHRIQEQMESIAESIVRLSEQSQAIGEIITTVNDLAEQSNVLAVNAAIEAAKAGEQGKGFGVVAQEVKSLAEQSKQATMQVRAILGDIQKATSAAVLATEQGHKAVEAGVKQSAQASDAIRQLSESISDAAQAATQIAASSQQQMVGMDQVALAMDNIKLTSTQNVAGTRQAEAAAQSLHELGVKLGGLVGRAAA